jgi:hypothetical protein
MGTWILTGQIVVSGTGKSLRVFMITEDNKRVCIGLIPRKTVSKLLRGDIWIGDICQYDDKPQTQPAEQEAFGFTVRAADPAKLGAPNP